MPLFKKFLFYELFQDTWTSHEVVYALRHGYKLVSLHEMLLYDQSQPIFRDFHLHLARMKIGSEGWPKGVDMDEERQRYLDSINQRMNGLNLKAEDVALNKSRRNFAKYVRMPVLFRFSGVVNCALVELPPYC